MDLIPQDSLFCKKVSISIYPYVKHVIGTILPKFICGFGIFEFLFLENVGLKEDSLKQVV